MSTGEWRAGEVPQKGVVAFGPRWRNIARMRLAERSGLAELELAERFADDLAHLRRHPALTDMAATFGLHLIDRAERASNLFVPMSVERIRLVAPMTRRTISRVELTGPTGDRFAAFDVEPAYA